MRFASDDIEIEYHLALPGMTPAPEDCHRKDRLRKCLTNPSPWPEHAPIIVKDATGEATCQNEGVRVAEEDLMS